LSAGQQLIIPRAPTLLLSANDRGEDADDPGRAADSGRADPDAVVATATSARRVTPEPARRTTTEPTRLVHRVKAGETLFTIAQKYNTSVGAVRQANKLHGDTIMVGQRLTILSNAKGSAKGATQAD